MSQMVLRAIVVGFDGDDDDDAFIVGKRTRKKFYETSNMHVIMEQIGLLNYLHVERYFTCRYRRSRRTPALDFVAHYLGEGHRKS